MTKFIDNLVRYVHEILGIHVSVEQWTESKQLPLYLRENYEYFRMEIRTQLLDADFMLLVDTGNREQAASIIGKHMAHVQVSYGGDVVYVRRALKSYNRKRLIEHHIPFIVPGNQMYLPMLGIDLREHMKLLKEKRRLFSPATQVLVLHLLLTRNTDLLTPKKLAKQLGYSDMTMTRAFDQLEMDGIGKHSREGRQRCLFIEASRKDMWEETRQYLSSPVAYTFYTLPNARIPAGKVAGESALSRYSMLAEPKIQVLAISGRSLKQIERHTEIQKLQYAESGSNKIEIWKYPPEILSRERTVDRLSLYLSLKDSRDERVQAALDELMKGMKW